VFFFRPGAAQENELWLACRAKLHLKHLMNDKKKTIVVVDDQPLFRERLSQLLNHELDMEVREEAENVEQAIAFIRNTSPDLAMANITLKGLSGLELIKGIKALSIRVPVLVLSPHDNSLYAERALRAGATGYITKHQPASEFLFAVRRVLAGEVYLSEKMRSLFLKRIVTARVKSVGREIDRLTARELDVLALSGRGRTTREIAKCFNSAWRRLVRIEPGSKTR
jgi:DNA-binding NarL/FixJ family response regulator